MVGVAMGAMRDIWYHCAMVQQNWTEQVKAVVKSGVNYAFWETWDLKIVTQYTIKNDTFLVYFKFEGVFWQKFKTKIRNTAFQNTIDR